MVYRGDYRNLRLMLSDSEVDDGLVEPVCEALGGEWRVPTLREALGARLGRDAAAGVSVLGGLAVGVVPGLGGAGMVAGRTPPFEFGDAGAAPLSGVANIFSGALAAESLGGVRRMPALAGAESLSPPPYVGRVLCVEEIGEGHFATPNPAEVQFNSEGDSREERFYVEVVRPTRRGSERVSLSADFRATVVDSDAALDVWTFSDDDGCAKEGETRSLADTAEGDYHCVAERNVEFADWCVRKRDAEIVFAGSALRCENRRSDSPIVSETQQRVICRPFGRHYQWYLLNGKTAQFWCTPNGGTTCKADEYYDADLHKCLERGRDWVGLASAGHGASGELGYTVRVFSPYGPSQDYVGTIFAAERSSVSVPDVGGVAGSGIELGDDVLLAGISSAHGGAAVDARFRYRGVWRGLHWIRSVDVLDEGVLESSCAAAGAGWRVPTLAETMMMFDNGDSFRASEDLPSWATGGLLPGLHDFAVEYPARTAADDWSSAPESGESFAALAGAYSTVRVGTRSRAVAAVNSSAAAAEFEGVVYCAQAATGRYVGPADYAGLEFGVGEARAVSDDTSALAAFQTVTVLAVRQTREGSAYGGVADVSLVGDSDLRVDVRREGSGAYVAALLADASAAEFGETTATLAATVAGGAGLEYVATLRLGQAVFAGEALAHGFVTVAEVGAVNANDGSQTTITMTYAGRRRGLDMMHSDVAVDPGFLNSVCAAGGVGWRSARWGDFALASEGATEWGVGEAVGDVPGLERERVYAVGGSRPRDTDEFGEIPVGVVLGLYSSLRRSDDGRPKGATAKGAVDDGPLLCVRESADAGVVSDARLVGAEMRVVGALASHPARGAESRALLTARIRPVYYDAAGAVYPEVDVDVFLDPGGTLNAESGNDNPRVSNLSLSVSVDGRETTAVVYAVPSRHSGSIAIELVATTALGASYLARTIVLDDSGAAPRAVVDGRPLRLGGTLAFRALDIHSREAKVVSVVYRRPFRGLEIYETLRPQGEGLLESVCGAGEDRWRVPGFAETHALLLSRDDSPTLRVFGSQAGLPSGALGEFSFGDAPALIPSDDVSPLSGGGYWSGAFTSETNAQSGLRTASRVGFDSDSGSSLARIVCAREVGDSSTAFSFYGESFEGESDLPQVARIGLRRGPRGGRIGRGWFRWRCIGFRLRRRTLKHIWQTGTRGTTRFGMLITRAALLIRTRGFGRSRFIRAAIFRKMFWIILFAWSRRRGKGRRMWGRFGRRLFGG